MYKYHYLNSIIIFCLTNFASSSLLCNLQVATVRGSKRWNKIFRCCLSAVKGCVERLNFHAVVPGLRCWPLMLLVKSEARGWSFFFMFTVVSQDLKKVCFEQNLLTVLRRLFFYGKWLDCGCDISFAKFFFWTNFWLAIFYFDN